MIFVTILSGLMVLSAAGRHYLYLEEPSQTDSVSDKEAVQLKDLLNQVDLESGIVIVQKGGSIQDAVDAAMPGDVIYIEPNIYREALEIDKSDIQLIGLNIADNKAVILENPGDI